MRKTPSAKNLLPAMKSNLVSGAQLEAIEELTTPKMGNANLKQREKPINAPQYTISLSDSGENDFSDPPSR